MKREGKKGGGMGDGRNIGMLPTLADDQVGSFAHGTDGRAVPVLTSDRDSVPLVRRTRVIGSGKRKEGCGRCIKRVCRFPARTRRGRKREREREAEGQVGRESVA